jgi:hypothetical protein
MCTSLKRSIVALAALLVFATPALAGPPLICNAFETGGGKLLLWGSGPSWNSPHAGYDLKKLVGETTALLAADAPVLTRMENMRRAAIYAMRDPIVARDLLKAVMSRALAATTDARALFDAGYLVETYKQAMHLRQDPRPELRLWAAVEEAIRLDGYAWVKKALAMSGPSAEMEFAASLMTRDPIAASHRAKALEVAGKGSLVARNIAKLGL